MEVEITTKQKLILKRNNIFIKGIGLVKKEDLTKEQFEKLYKSNPGIFEKIDVPATQQDDAIDEALEAARAEWIKIFNGKPGRKGIDTLKDEIATALEYLDVTGNAHTGTTVAQMKKEIKAHKEAE